MNISFYFGTRRLTIYVIAEQFSQHVVLKTLCCFFVMLLIFVSVFFSIPLLIAYDTTSDHLCVCMSVQDKVCLKRSNNPLAQTLHTEGFLYLYSLSSRYFKSPLFKMGTTVASIAFRIQYDK